MTSLKKIKMEKSHMDVPNELYVIETLTKLLYCYFIAQKKQLFLL